MKKNVLASSVAAALVGLGMAGAAHANKVLVVPYYTAQAEHATLLNIVNTDTLNGKVVKVRFRGAANSDDVFDFQVFLSPGDVWSGNVSSSEDGPAKLNTTDATCTKPAKAVLNSTPFVTTRLNPALSAAEKANQTREGYIEIFTMANVPQTGIGDGSDTDTINDLYTAIKHVNGVAPCSGSAWTALDKAVNNVGQRATAAQSVSDAAALGLAVPTPGLFANYTIINVARAGAWDGEAENLSYFDNLDPLLGANRVPYWPQTQEAVGSAVNLVSADPLFLGAADALLSDGATPVPSAAIKAAYYDLPDLSTPYQGDLTSSAVPSAQAWQLSNILAATSIANEFLVGPAEATTDWVFSMPTRRYSVAMNYAEATASGDGRRFNADLHGQYYGSSNTVVVGGLICVKGITREIYNREEGSVANPDEVVVSPSELPPETSFCGEASVLSINGGGAQPTATLSANVAVNDIDTTYQEGWMRLATPGAGAVVGLPVIGASHTRALSGDSFFAGSWKHRTGLGFN